MTRKTRYLKVKLDCLQQNSFQSHHLLSWVLVNIIVIRNSEQIPMKKSKCCVSVEAPAWKCWTEHHWSDSWQSWSNPWKDESKQESNQKVWHSLALLRSFLSFASQEQNTGSSDLNASLNKFRVLIATYISWKLLETMFHVESERKQMFRTQR